MGGEDDAWPFEKATNSLKTCGLIDFTSFEVIRGVTGAYVLIVWGKDNPRIDPRLNPYVYIQKPDYWDIEVTGCLGDFVPPKRFPLVRALEGTMGHKGIRLIGATKVEQWNRPKN